MELARCPLVEVWTQLAKLFQDHHYVCDFVCVYVCVCVSVIVCACVGVCEGVSWYLFFLEDVNLFFVLCSQATCRQMESLPL